MNKGFYTILAAQFFSSLGDNALLFAAIALLKTLHSPAWQTPVLQQCFVFAFIILAPFVGIFSDAMPKGRVMLISNSVKMLGCAAMLLGLHPLVAYALVGIGAAMYSPAKYGILAEYLPPSRLVWANGWMEGLTVAAIILGAILGGWLLQSHTSSWLQDLLPADLAQSAPSLAISIILVLYALAALINAYIPKLPIEHAFTARSLPSLLNDFRQAFLALWRDPLGQVSLAVTALFWGTGTTLRFVILVWSAEALHFELTQATQLTAVVAIGIAIGSVIAAKQVVLEHAVKVLPLGMLMGIVVAAMVWVSDWRIAIAMLILVGTLAGVFVIPMNALLQHRGYQLMGAGHSIAVQNFNENLAILLMLGGYAVMIHSGLSINSIVVIFGGFIFGSMGWLYRRHGHDQDA